MVVVDHVSMAHRHAAFIVLSSIAEPLLMRHGFTDRFVKDLRLTM
jgi:hypothetical protein